jgi:hypothetical protein
MSKFAFRDKERTQKVYADSLNIKDINTRFYCPNPECSALLTLKANSSIAGIPPYFSNLPSTPHIANCFCHKNNFSFDDREYEEVLFNFEEIVNEYTTNNIINIDRRLETMSAIFYMCKTRNINDTYNQIKIWKILVDNRANHIYSKGIIGPHIIECYFSYYSNDDLTIYLKYPINNSLSNKYNVGISFTDEELFKEIRNKLFNNDKKKYPVLVIGNWEYDSKNNLAQTSINSSFQIYFRK